MLQRGDIVVERLTGRRALVIKLNGPEEVCCRFGDGRLEDRYTFELELAPPPLAWLLSLLIAPFMGRPLLNGAGSAPAGRVRPLIPRPSSSA